MPNGSRICDMYENYCYNEIVMNDLAYISQFCTCLPNCNKFQINAQTMHIKTNIFEDLCEEPNELGWQYAVKLLEGLKVQELNEAMIDNGLENLYQNLNLSDHQSVCKYLVKNEWSYVIVGLSQSTGMLILQDVRVEFVTMVATIGNL